MLHPHVLPEAVTCFEELAAGDAGGVCALHVLGCCCNVCQNRKVLKVYKSVFKVVLSPDVCVLKNKLYQPEDSGSSKSRKIF